MEELNDLKKVEKRLYFSYSNDGLADILMGLWMILAGFFMLIGQPAFMGLSGLPVLLYLPLKRSIVIPRLGDVTFSKERKKRLSNVAIYSIIAGAILLFFIIFRSVNGSKDHIIAQHLNVIFGLIIALLFSFLALFTTITRFYGYAVFAIILFSLDKLLFHSIPLNQLVFGIIVFVIGIIYLGRFLINNPIPKTDKNDSAEV